MIEYPGKILALAISPNEKLVLASTNTNDLLIWELKGLWTRSACDGFDSVRKREASFAFQSRETLLEAGALKGRTVTSWPSLKTDIKNAGGNWVDQAVVTDGQFIFSRKPDDIPAFNKAIIEAVAQGVQEHAHA